MMNKIKKPVDFLQRHLLLQIIDPEENKAGLQAEE